MNSYTLGQYAELFGDGESAPRSRVRREYHGKCEYCGAGFSTYQPLRRFCCIDHQQRARWAQYYQDTKEARAMKYKARKKNV